MADNAQPLNNRIPIVNPDGTPTDFLIRWAQQFSRNTVGSKEATQWEVQGGVGIDGGGPVSEGVTLDANTQEILDQLGVDQGSILFRGATDWQTLLPGTAGRFLKTNGADADPEWAAGGGGGGGSLWWFAPPSASSFSLASGDATNLALADDPDVGLMLASGASANTSRMAYVSLTDKTQDWDFVTRLDIIQTTTNFSRAGVALRDSVSGRVIFHGTTNNIGIATIKDSSLGSFSSTAFQSSLTVGMSLKWFRIQFTGGNYVFYFGPDGKQWMEVFSETSTNWLTNRADQVGFIMNPNTQRGYMSCGHFSLIGPGV